MENNQKKTTYFSMKEFMLHIPDWIVEYLCKCRNSLGILNGRALKKHLTDKVDGWFRENGLSPYYVQDCITDDGYVCPIVCPECGKRINLYGIVTNRKHIKYCSVGCGKTARERNKKKTCLEKYGTEYPLQSKEIQERILNTVVERYGVRSTTLVPEVREKQAESIRKRFGVGCPLESEEVKEKIFDMIGSDFEGGFKSRGTSLLSTLPFLELNLNDPEQRALYREVVELSKRVQAINALLLDNPSKKRATVLGREKENAIARIEDLIDRVYSLEFVNEA